jgi:hypothetical protein
MFNQPNSREVFVVEPVYIRMSERLIARPSIDITVIHCPQIRHNVDVLFDDVSGYICVDHTWIKNRLH